MWGVWCRLPGPVLGRLCCGESDGNSKNSTTRGACMLSRSPDAAERKECMWATKASLLCGRKVHLQKVFSCKASPAFLLDYFLLWEILKFHFQFDIHLALCSLPFHIFVIWKGNHCLDTIRKPIIKCSLCLREREREVAQSCLTLRDAMDCSPPGSSVHGIFQARVLEWGAIAFSDVLMESYNMIKNHF